MQNKVEFKVAAVSDNANSFGLYQMILVARAGPAFTACKSNPPAAGQVVTVNVGSDGMIESSPHFNFEIPHQLSSPPESIIKELWKK